VDRRPPSDLGRTVIPNRQNALTTLASTSVDQARPRDEISGLEALGDESRSGTPSASDQLSIAQVHALLAIAEAIERVAVAVEPASPGHP
jgi:hypothetical protein